MADIAIRDASIADSEDIARLVTALGYRTSSSQMRSRLEAILRDKDYNTLVSISLATRLQTTDRAALRE